MHRDAPLTMLTKIILKMLMILKTRNQRQKIWNQQQKLLLSRLNKMPSAGPDFLYKSLSTVILMVMPVVLVVIPRWPSILSIDTD